MDETPTSRRSLSPAKHSEILWSAVQLFAKRGIAATTTRDIAAQAGTTERTLFKHFGTKDRLVRAVLDEAVLSHLAPVSLSQLAIAIESFGGNVQAWHEALLASRLEALIVAPELTRLLTTELLRDDEVRSRFAEAWRGAAWLPLVALFENLQRDRLLRKDIAAEALARQFLSLNLGFLLSRILLAPDREWNDRKEIAAIAKGFAALSAP